MRKFREDPKKPQRTHRVTSHISTDTSSVAGEPAPPTASSATHVRARGPRKLRTPAETNAIVDEIADLMVQGMWVAGSSHKRLAEKHGAALATVRSWAIRASTKVLSAANPGDLNEKRATYVGTQERIGRHAEALANADRCSKCGRGGRDDADRLLRVASNAYDKAAEVSGVKYDTRMPQVQVNVNVVEDPAVRLLFETIVGALRSLSNGKEAARAVVAAVEKLGGPISRAMIGERPVIDVDGGN